MTDERMHLDHSNHLGSASRFATDPPDLPLVRMIVGVGRSGTSALLRPFGNHPQAATRFFEEHPARYSSSTSFRRARLHRATSCCLCESDALHNVGGQTPSRLNAG
jgi:hypothetical protein